ncbi:hypothetical protein G5I_06464 [Acromyrmex echinatior]|uniref:Uncharacterized protein n=1 Tax=Acromyrmex echinatior TaxID=103372 RepID=F4WL40_ACREC|nr:hypothetical protein G5I_06464 [Acromyrmex echinatior]
MFAVNGNGDHLLAVKFQAVSLLWTPVSGRTLMQHNADRMDIDTRDFVRSTCVHFEIDVCQQVSDTHQQQ